jgi:alkanesulfonate monooxygenase SsuD/methylene tetrahydromethanopterin reductase-like flavin-dependent oxidoreductase (luciferase family)
VRIGLVILPTDPWHKARRQWEWADDVGFTTAWTYDHIRWGGMPDGPWYGTAIPVLAAAAVVTTRIRLGTLVATPNFRHPVTLARDALTLDDLSAGRLDLGLGPGSQGHDATALGQDPWAPAERLGRFRAFLQVLAPILEGGDSTRTSLRTDHYEAVEAPSTPGSVQRPIPLTIAAGGTRGMRLAAIYGRNWVTVGPTSGVPHTPETVLEAVRHQRPLLDAACETTARDPGSIGKVLLWMPYEPRITSADQFDEIAAPYVELGFDEFVLHHPDQTGPFGGDPGAFEEIARRYAAL